MCLLNQKTIGVRALCGPDTFFKYYLDDLNGITYQNYAKVAMASKTASGLFKQAIDYGIQSTMNDILFSTPSPIQLNSISNVYYHREFTDTILPVFVGERGLTVQVLNPTSIQYSTAVIRRIYIKSRYTQLNNVININVNGLVVKSVNADFFQDEVVVIELNEAIKANNFSITFDQTNSLLYQAEFNSQYQCCGSVNSYSNGFDYLMTARLGRFRVSGGFGISADIDLICDEEKLTCTLLPYFGEEVRFKAGIYLANEVLVSDRLELFVINNKEDILQLAQAWQKDYDSRLQRKVPQILNSLRGTDKCCFRQLGVSQAIQLV